MSTDLESKNELPPNLEADRTLLNFETWEDYLDSLLEVKDLRYLGNLEGARKIASLGYRSLGEFLAEKEFYRRKENVELAIHQKKISFVLYHADANLTRGSDPLLLALAEREFANRMGLFQSIIYIRLRTKSGFELSGYIDFAHRLLLENWTSFFKRNKLLKPKDSDLGYYHWRHGTVRSNITRNYVPQIHKVRGLIFQNRHDHKHIYPNPRYNPGQSTSKYRIVSPRYLQIEIYDHELRRRKL